LINTKLQLSNELKNFFATDPNVQKLIFIKQEKLDALYWESYCKDDTQVNETRTQHDSFYVKYAFCESGDAAPSGVTVVYV